MNITPREAYIVETKLGKVEAKATDADHVYVAFGGNYDKGEALIVRGVPIRGSAHFYKYGDGQWHIGMEFSDKEKTKLSTTYEKRTSLFLTRAEQFSITSPSEHAREVIHQVLTFTVDEWIHSVEGKAAIKEAGVRQRIEDIAAIEAEIGEAEGNVTRLKAKLAARRDRP